MAKKKPVKTVKRSTKNTRREELIQEAAEQAAAEAISRIEDETLDIEDDETNEGEDMELNFNESNTHDSEPDYTAAGAYDIFEEAYQKASRIGQVPRYHIKKGGERITTLGYPCSWDLIQKKYGGGHYQVEARLPNGQLLNRGSEILADLEEDTKEESHQEVVQQQSGPTFLEMMTLLNQAQEKSEQKARETAAQQQQAMALMMQSMIQANTQAQQQFQMMMMEMNKQSQNQAQSQQQLMTTLLTSLLAKKEDGSGFNAATVMKMVQDASRDAESRTKQWYELVEKKAETLAEEKAQAMASQGGEEDESITKTVIKGFVPLIGQLMANQQPASPRPEGPQASQVPQQVGIMGNQRPQIPQAPQAPQAPQVPGNNLTPRPNPMGATAAGPARLVKEVGPQAEKVVKESSEVVNVGPGSQENKTVSIKARLVKAEGENVKDQIFELLKGDIAQAYLLKRDAGKTAQACLKKLEKKGFVRQTVLNAFTLEDFFALAQQYGVLDSAKPWITEFYETLSKEASISPGNVTKPSSRAEILT